MVVGRVISCVVMVLLDTSREVCRGCRRINSGMMGGAKAIFLTLVLDRLILVSGVAMSIMIRGDHMVFRHSSSVMMEGLALSRGLVLLKVKLPIMSGRALTGRVWSVDSQNFNGDFGDFDQGYYDDGQGYN